MLPVVARFNCRSWKNIRILYISIFKKSQIPLPTSLGEGFFATRLFFTRDRKIIAHLWKSEENYNWSTVIRWDRFVSAFDNRRRVLRNRRGETGSKIESNSFENVRIIYDGETFLWLVSPRRQFAASPGSPSETKFGWSLSNEQAVVLPVIGNGARITACPIFNFAVRFVADNVRNDGVEIGCNDLYFFFFF